MILFCDNDILLKLAACDLLDDALESLGVDAQDVRVLPTAKWVFDVVRNRAKGEEKYGRAIHQRICSFLQKAPEINPPCPHELQLLDDVMNVDPGDAILISGTVGFTEYLLATGDKRCLTALACNERCRPIAERLRGHVICLEQIIKKSIQQFGFERIKKKVVPAVDCDTALRAVFGTGLDAVEANVIRDLDAYIQELRAIEVDMLGNL